jgi:hypothetical protein
MKQVLVIANTVIKAITHSFEFTSVQLLRLINYKEKLEGTEKRS